MSSADSIPPEPADTPRVASAEIAARTALRRRLLADRKHFAQTPQGSAAQAALADHLARLLREIEPALLGLYWPVRGEFNAIVGLEAAGLTKLPLALPFTQREPREMHYRRWNRLPPTGSDDFGLPAPAQGLPVVPDVVLAPCVGYTPDGFRLGYGGGFFDRWLARHPQATAIGIAWSAGRLAEGALRPQPHDRPLVVVLTEQGVVI